jgi:nitrous oxidase accessory protein NosD
MLKASAIGVGASMGLVGTASAAGDVVEFDESLTITQEDSGKTFRQVADFDGSVDIESAEDVTVDGNGYTIFGGDVTCTSSVVDGIGQVDPEDITFQNIHLPDGRFVIFNLYGAVIRNNVANGIYIDSSADFRVVDNTFDGTIQTEENTSDTVFARNVAASIRVWGDLSDSHRVSSNFVTGSDNRVGIEFLQGDGLPGAVAIVGNYVGNAGSFGIDITEDMDMDVEVRRNVVVGSADHGLYSLYPPTDVSENTLIGNGGDGVRGSVSRLKNNVATANGGDGFRVDVGRDCLRNAAVSNDGAGFRFSEQEFGFLASSTGDAQVKFNRSTGNHDGMVLSGFTVGAIRKNDLTANGGNGLVLEDSDGNGVTRNWVCGNDGEQLIVDGDSTDNRFKNNTIC